MVESQSTLGMQIGLGAVNVISAKINFRTLNQGHSIFSAVLDNAADIYTGVFDAMNSVYLNYNGVIIFRGVLDSAKHAYNQDEKWDFNDTLRLAGRDMSFDLSNFKITYERTIATQAMKIAKYAVESTACDVAIAKPPIGNITMDGYACSDMFLLDVVTKMLEVSGYEGYVGQNKSLTYFVKGSMTTGITLNTTNVLSHQPVEFDGIDIRNNIKVLGKLNLWYPEVDDAWTDITSLLPPPLGAPGPSWVLNIGTAKTEEPGGIINAGKYLKFTTAGPFAGKHIAQPVFIFPEVIKVGYHGQYEKIAFWIGTGWSTSSTSFKVLLYSNTSNYFYTDLIKSTDWWRLWGGWHYFELPLGMNYMKTSDPQMSDGIWHSVGTPNWGNIIAASWVQEWNAPANISIDGLFIGKRCSHAESVSLASVASYHTREHLVETDSASNAECQVIADDLANKMSTPVKTVQVVCPLSIFIVGGVWKGLPGYCVTLNLPGCIGEYRIVDLTADIAPFNNLKNGYDAIATVNLVPTAGSYHPDSVASVLNPKIASMLKRYKTK